MNEATRSIAPSAPGSATKTVQGLDWGDFKAALKNAVPLMVEVAVSGLAYGIVARQAGLSWLESCAMSLLVFAGAAQFTAVGMLSTGGMQISLIVFTTLLINLRHLLYGASLAPYLKRLSIKWQALLAFGMVDESYALTIARFSTVGISHLYQLGANLAIYLAWATASGAGAALGGLIRNPLRWGLDFTMPACFIVLLIPLLKGWKEVLVCLTAGALAVAGMSCLPGKWYIIVAALTATLIGGGVEELCVRKCSC